MRGFKCDTCQWLGREPDLHRELDKVDGGAARYVVVQTCPDCGGEELREVALCLDCADSGVDTLATHDDLCQPCAALNFEPEDMEAFKRDAETDEQMRDGMRELFRSGA